MTPKTCSQNATLWSLEELMFARQMLVEGLRVERGHRMTRRRWKGARLNVGSMNGPTETNVADSSNSG